MFRRSDIIDPAHLSGSVEATAPNRLSPQLLTLSKVVPGGDNWLHEIKHDGFGMTVYEQACQLGLEGIVSKRGDSSYLAGRRSRSWLKIKNPQYHRDTAGSWRKG